jgi:hypothetical protein
LERKERLFSRKKVTATVETRIVLTIAEPPPSTGVLKHKVDLVLSRVSEVPFQICPALKNNMTKKLKNLELKTKTKLKKKKKEFRLTAKELFLTYPACPILPSEALELIRDIVEEYDLQKYIITQETHGNNSASVNVGTHLHAYLKLGRRVDTKNPRFFDLQVLSDLFHGQYERVKNTTRVIQYCLKDQFDMSAVTMSDNLRHSLSDHHEILGLDATLISLAKKGKIGEALEMLEREDPKRYLRGHVHFEKSMREIFLRTQNITRNFNMSNYSAPFGLADALKSNVKSNKSIVVHGSSGLGKTQFILTFVSEVLNLNPLMINNYDALRYFNPSLHNCIILDDCCLEELDRETLIKVLDLEVDVTLKMRYSNVIINQGIPRFIIQNQSLLKVHRYGKDKAVQRRLVEYDLGNKVLIKAELVVRYDPSL